MFARLITGLLTAASLALADLAVTSPAGGASIANTALSVELSGAAGMNVQVQVLAGGQKADGSDSIVVYSPAATAYTGPIAISVPPATGPLATFHAYYIKVIGTPAAGAPSYAFSSRFALSGMSGNWPSPAIQQAAQAAAAKGDTAVPANVAGQAAGAGAGAADPAAASSAGIAFSLQTGLTKYAPMQQKPGTTITATDTKPLYPTSSWSVFTTLAPIPTQITTVTPSATYSASSRENTASPAALPSDDMAKYLARWKD